MRQKRDTGGCSRGKQGTGKPLDGSKETSGFTGGFIVQTYGSHTGYGIDAIQLEFGGDFRAKENLKDTAAKVANAVRKYSDLYLSEKANGKGGER